MRNTIAFAVATALIACGGSVAPRSSEALNPVEVSTDLSTIGVLPAYPMYATLDVYTDAAGTLVATGFTQSVPTLSPAPVAPKQLSGGPSVSKFYAPCSPVNPSLWSPTAPPSNCWDSFNAKFQKVTLNLLGPGTYYVTAKFYATDPRVSSADIPNPAAVPAPIATDPARQVLFNADGTGTLAFVPAATETTDTAGVTFTSLTSSIPVRGFSAMYVGESNTFNATAIDNTNLAATPTFTYAAAAATGGTCVGSFGTGATANVFSGIASGNKCKITITATSGTRTAQRIFTISGSNATTVSGGGVKPSITKFTLAGSDPSDVTCTIEQPYTGTGASKTYTGWTGTSNVTCPQAFKLAATPQNPSNWFSPQTNWGIFTVNYDVSTAGVDANNPPSVSIRTFCSQDAYVFDPALAPDATTTVPGFQYILPVAPATPATHPAGGYPAGCLNNAAAPCFNMSAANYGDAFWPAFSLNSYYDTINTTPVTTLQTEPTWWAEPVIANNAFVWDGSGNGPAPLCAVAPRDPITGAASGACGTAPTMPIQCAFQVIVSNQGAKDRVMFFANFQ